MITNLGGYNLNGLALCAGVGGLELGLKIALPEYKCICYVERETYPAAILVSRMAEGILDEAPIWDDVETFDGRLWRGKVDIISAGFPCQPWSCAGERRGLEDIRWLWPSIQRIIRHIRPRYVFLENVPGILAGGLDPVLSDLAQIGYDAVWDMFSAASAGAPHLRKRIFILAVERMSLPNPDIKGFRPLHEAESGCHELGLSEGGDASADRGAMANTSGGRQPAELSDIPAGEQNPDRSNSRGGEMANPNGEGLFRERVRIGGETAHASTEQGRPRRPGWWEAEPRLGRVADGVAYRVDRIRACGNGVVPAVAARAFTELLGRFR